MNNNFETGSSWGKIDYQLILLTHIDRINKQLTRLPHEISVPNMNTMSGCTHDDIAKSYIDLVEQMEQLLKPYHDEEFGKAKLKDTVADSQFKSSKLLFGILMDLCDRNNYLLKQAIMKVSIEPEVVPDGYEIQQASSEVVAQNAQAENE